MRSFKATQYFQIIISEFIRLYRFTLLIFRCIQCYYSVFIVGFLLRTKTLILIWSMAYMKNCFKQNRNEKRLEREYSYCFKRILWRLCVFPSLPFMIWLPVSANKMMSADKEHITNIKRIPRVKLPIKQ